MSAPKSVVVEAELGPFEGRDSNGVEHDGEHVWVATGELLHAIDPVKREVVRELPVEADAGTAFDGTHLYQLTGAEIRKIDPATGKVVRSVPAPNGGGAGLTWAEGALWVGQHRDRKILRVDPETGEVTKTLESDRFVTGVTWSGGELWHATWESEQSDIRRIDPDSGAVLERYDAPAGMTITGLAKDGELFYAGSGRTGKVRVLRPER